MMRHTCGVVTVGDGSRFRGIRRWWWLAGLATLHVFIAAAASPPRSAEDSECQAPNGAPSPRPFLRGDDSVLVLRLNIPSYTLQVVEHGIATHSYHVAVGLPTHPTPIGRYALDYAEWNPWWYPPRTPWARNKRPARPGWSNPVGRVKLHVMGLVFLHGTSLVQSVGTSASHACVRVTNRDAIAIARLVHRVATPAIGAATLDSLEADTSATRRIPFAVTVPIGIRYELADIVADDLVIYPDIYRLAGQRVPSALEASMAAIRRVGRDTTGMQLRVLRRAMRHGRTRITIIPLDSLFAPLTHGAQRAP